MAKTVVVGWNEFFSRDTNTVPTPMTSSIQMNSLALPVMLPLAHLTIESGADRFFDKIESFGGVITNGVVMWCAFIWIFGNRTKAVEIFFSLGVGVQILRYHKEIADFLYSL